MPDMKRIQAELATAARLVAAADDLGLQRMGKLDELWAIEQKAIELRHQLDEVYGRIDQLLPETEAQTQPH